MGDEVDQTAKHVEAGLALVNHVGLLEKVVADLLCVNEANLIYEIQIERLLSPTSCVPFSRTFTACLIPVIDTSMVGLRTDGSAVCPGAFDERVLKLSGGAKSEPGPYRPPAEEAMMRLKREGKRTMKKPS